MKAIVGIDTNGAYKPALDLIARLRFPKPHLTLLHVAPSRCPIWTEDARADAEYTKVVQNLGLTALDGAVDEACGRDLPAKTKLIFGRAADGMMKQAEVEGADLIALCATPRGTWNTTFLGRANSCLAVNGKTSLLIAKGAVKRAKQFTAVLAVDHGTPCQAWVDKFLELAPKGITHLHIVSAFEVDDEAATATKRNLAQLGGDVERWLHETFAEKTQALADRLKAAGYHVTFSVIEDGAANAIRHAMQVHHADLLILGAHGCTQQAGARIGSVALHEIVAEPFPVLLIRP